MAFSTIQGSGGAPDSFVGTSGVDSISIVNPEKTFFLGAQPADDIVFVNDTGSVLYNAVVDRSTIKGGQGNDSFTSTGGLTYNGIYFNGNSNADTITFGAADVILASTIHGGQGTDSINTGGVQASLVNGNKNNDNVTVNAASASATIFGGQGNDSVTTAGALTGSVVALNKDNDRFTAGAVSHAGSSINGNEGSDTLTATNSTTGVYLEGGEGTDTILGANGIAANTADTITGGAGNDTMTGGTGADIFRYTGNGQATTVGTLTSFGAIDQITDFAYGAAGDVLGLLNSGGFGSAITFAGTAATLANNYANNTATLIQLDANTLIGSAAGAAANAANVAVIVLNTTGAAVNVAANTIAGLNTGTGLQVIGIATTATVANFVAGNFSNSIA